jgi:alpha-ketoglutaric semialdehyde dehydrogenase
MSQDQVQPVLIAGQWRAATLTGEFNAENPTSAEPLTKKFPKSDWADVNAALAAAAAAFDVLLDTPVGHIAAFLRAYADAIDANADSIATIAAEETGYPVSPRLRDVELPRTTGQLRQAADAAEDNSWRLPTIDKDNGICSILEPVGPVAVFGPNNFPLAFNGIAGGDFAAAIAAGNPVIAKAHSSHPNTCRALAECAQEAASKTGMPDGTVQLLYGLSREDGVKLVSDPRLGAAAFTGSRTAGMSLKAGADSVGKPIYLEMSSVNPVVILPGALAERSSDVVTELTTSALMGTGQFCTNPGLVFLVKGDDTDAFLKAMAEQYNDAPCGTLLGKGTQQGLVEGIKALTDAGAEVCCGNEDPGVPGYNWANTLLTVSAENFLADPKALQTEAFGNATLAVIAESVEQLPQLVARCEGNLTGCIYSANDGRDDANYMPVAKVLRRKVGRLLNDKMPTGVAVSPAMNHGGPFPATGHPHFTAVGIPAAMRRFTQLACYDNVRPERLPVALRQGL